MGVPTPEEFRAALRKRVDSDFRYHPPTDGQAEVFSDLREAFRRMAHVLIETVPPGRELSTALTKLEEAVMHANAGIARHG